MKKVISKLFLIIVITGLITVTGCKNDKDEGYDITISSWGFILTTGETEVGVVYDFEGNSTEGVVYHRQQNRGSYTVTNGINVNFTVEHYDAEGSTFIYTYTGSFIDYSHMSGSFTVRHPDGTIISGTWTALR